MNPQTFLAAVAEALGGAPRRWSDVVVVRNVGPLKTTNPLTGDNISNRGFNAIVFGAAGGPTHFLKVRPAAHASFEREAAVTVELASQPRLAHLVPASSTFVAGPARVLAQDYVEGTALDVVLRGRGRSTWHQLAAEVLHSTAGLRNAIEERPMAARRAGGAEGLRADFELLVGLGVDPAALRELAGRVESADLPLRPQHGDFWPRNVLQAEDGWRVLDYESCGQPATPLYDVFHFVRGCADTAAGDGHAWLPYWASAGRAARALGEEVRRAAGGVDQACIEAALVAYQVTFVATLHRRGIAPERIAGRLRELSELPGLLGQGMLERAIDAC